MPEEPNEPNQNEYILSPAEREVLAEFDAAMTGINHQAHGAILLILKQNGLPGTWKRSPEPGKLIRADA